MVVPGLHRSGQSLAEDAIALVGNKSRAILGIAGSPRVGKSTLVEQLLVRIRAIMGEQWAAHVPMDGFHSSASRACVARGLADVAARVAVVAMLAATARAAMAAAADDGSWVLDVYGGGLFPVWPVKVVGSAMSSTHNGPPLAVVT